MQANFELLWSRKGADEAIGICGSHANVIQHPIQVGASSLWLRRRLCSIEVFELWIAGDLH